MENGNLRLLLLVAMGACGVGAVVTDAKMKLKIGLAVLALFLIYAWIDYDLNSMQAGYLFVLAYFFPHSIGAWFQRKKGKYLKKK
ncbi:MAG: hypothetical protein ACOX2O_04035 [Bdellovibrionota bacterium]|jgi:hypothetical protein